MSAALRRLTRPFLRAGRAVAKPSAIGALAASDASMARYERLAAWFNTADIDRRRGLLSEVSAPCAAAGGGLGEIDAAAGFLISQFDAADPVFSTAQTRCLSGLPDSAAWGKTKGSSNFISRKQFSIANPEDRAVFALAADPRILDPVARYLGMTPAFEKAVFWYAPETRKFDGGSQELHRDGNARRQIKLFVFLDEVDAESGPLTVMSVGDSEALYERLAGTKNRAQVLSDRGFKVSDALLDRIGSDLTLRPLTGPAGTLVFADTSRCYHFGSRPGARSRKVLMLKYVTVTARNLPLWGRRPQPAPDSFAGLGGHSQEVLDALFAYAL